MGNMELLLETGGWATGGGLCKFWEQSAFRNRSGTPHAQRLP
jgi:hypothetical protein